MVSSLSVVGEVSSSQPDCGSRSLSRRHLVPACCAQGSLSWSAVRYSPPSLAHRLLSERRLIGVLKQNADVLHVADAGIQSEALDLLLKELLIELRHGGLSGQLVEIELSQLNTGADIGDFAPDFLFTPIYQA